MKYAAFLIALIAVTDVPSEGIDCSPEAVRHFSTKVNPVLQNSCVACHANATKYSLIRQRDGATVATTQANLAASLTLIDRKNPAASPLLLKAIAAHGGATAPAIKDANAPAYKQLELWVRMVAGDGMAKPAVVGTSGETVANREVKRDVFRDEFDPEIFNRQYRGN